MTFYLATLKLPIIFCCENNHWAQFTPDSIHMSIKDVAERARSYDIESEIVDNDVIEIYGAAGKAVERARKGEGPTLLEIKCNRWFGHYVGDPQKYRDKDDIQKARDELGFEPSIDLIEGIRESIRNR